LAQEVRRFCHVLYFDNSTHKQLLPDTTSSS
jgi:hypothetical protein